MSIEFLDPTYEGDSSQFVLADRLTTLEGTTIGLISNGKEGTKRFFEALERTLLEDHRVSTVVCLTKKNYSAPAEPSILAQAGRWDAVVAGVGD